MGGTPRLLECIFMSNVADSLFSSLSENDLSFVEHQLSSNESASDEELHTCLVESGLSDAQATQGVIVTCT